MSGDRAERPVRYFAYGSNMSSAQMAARCPDCGPAVIGRLADRELLINERGVATVVAAPGQAVLGVVWSISHADRVTLDRFEGVRDGRYDRWTAPVVLPDGATVEATIYIDHRTTPGRPRVGYIDKLVTGAREHGLPADYVAALARLEIEQGEGRPVDGAAP